MTNCKHTKYEAAGHLTPSGNDIQTYTMYKVYCHQCENFVNLLDGSTCNDEGLVKVSDINIQYER